METSYLRNVHGVTGGVDGQICKCVIADELVDVLGQIRSNTVRCVGIEVERRKRSRPRLRWRSGVEKYLSKCCDLGGCC